ncbi:MAG: hypothetical protein HY698_01915 [Deltaproteobacteria bacterium]|nr:hypothetical protein [Deltaproteobacteria bacterium]
MRRSAWGAWWTHASVHAVVDRYFLYQDQSPGACTAHHEFPELDRH